MTNLISFDWAMKRVLRDKANHAVLEGLMTSLLNEKFTIVRFLESESNQEDENDKFDRVDILAESEKGELTIFEIQNNRELAYFHRILYGVSKASPTTSTWAKTTRRCARCIPSTSYISPLVRQRTMCIMARPCSKVCTTLTTS